MQYETYILGLIPPFIVLNNCKKELSWGSEVREWKEKKKKKKKKIKSVSFNENWF